MNEREIVERLRHANEYEPLGHDAWEAADTIERLLARAEIAEKIVRDTLWMAGRYADGRKTYAVSMYNDALAQAKAAGIDGDARPALDGMAAGYPGTLDGWIARAEKAERERDEATTLLRATLVPMPTHNELMRRVESIRAFIAKMEGK